MSRDASVVHFGRLDMVIAPQPWAFADDNRAVIDAYFAALRRATPALWNGRVLMMVRHALDGAVFRGWYLETDYASFTAWRHWGHARDERDCFGAAAVVSADGAVLLGLMGDRTVNAGQLYFFCGTPDLNDVADGKVDLDFSVARELKEESGLDIAELSAEPGWTTVIEGPRIAHIKVLRSTQDADTLRARMLAHLASEQHPELSDICIVRGIADIDRRMARFVTVFLEHHFGERR
jgi:hypothetical protein